MIISKIQENKNDVLLEYNDAFDQKKNINIDCSKYISLLIFKIHSFTLNKMK